MPIGQLDPAIVRPGRLAGAREFRRLSRAEAECLAAKKGLALPEQEDFSLAELYAGTGNMSSLTTDTASTERKTIPTRPQDVRVPRAQRVSTRHDARYILLKKYEGVVTSRGEQSFTARLFENASDYPVVEAEFDLDELSETDRELAVEGASLVWTIGYGYDGSTRKRESAIYLRRLPPWSDKEIEQGSRAAEDLTRGIQWE
jgi:hypothetical protein